jgi:hypothetical protein
MAQAVSVEQHDINAVAGGGAITLTTSSIYNLYRLYTDTTITAAATVVASDVPVGVVSFNILLDADITFGGAGSFTVFGTSIPERLLQKGTIFTAVYNGTSYVVSTSTPLTVSDVVANTNIVDNTITLGKLALVTAGYIIVANGSGQFTAVAMSGDITISNSGVVTIGAGKITVGMIAADAVRTANIKDENITVAKLEASIQAYLGAAQTLAYFSVTIPTASVLTGYSVPVTLVAAVSGKIIQPVCVWQSMTYNSVAYATNGVCQVKLNGASVPLFTSTANGFLFGTVSRKVGMTANAATGTTDTQLVGNADLLWTVGTANPTAGNSGVTVSGLYILADA